MLGDSCVAPSLRHQLEHRPLALGHPGNRILDGAAPLDHRGETVRRLIDCLIAAHAIREGVAVLHADSDFDRLAGCTPLQVCPVG